MSENATRKRYVHLITDIEATYHGAARKLGLSDSAMLILYTICYNGEKCLLSDIVSSSGISKQTISSALRRLETEDIVYLERAAERKKMVCLTPKGKEFAKNTVRKVMDAEDAIFASWTEPERSTYIRLTQKYSTDLKRKISGL